jgi:3-hydroxybutyryl-CoA dehydrogenase
MEIRKVGVVGCGVMGSGIVHATAVAGFKIIFISRSPEKVERDIRRVKQSLAKAVEKNKLSEEDVNQALERIRGSNRLEELASCDLVIETIIEDMDQKKDVFQRLDGLVHENVILTTNTSSFSISTIAGFTDRPERVAGLHFFVPAQAMKLVEVVRGDRTDDEIMKTLQGFARALGKEPVTVKDSPGFIVNHFLVPYLNHVIQAVDDGLASREDIDTAVRLGFGITLGPLRMLDLIGLDIQLRMAEILYAQSGDPRFAPPPLLKKMVEEGCLGRKTKKGFFDYE